MRLTAIVAAVVSLGVLAGCQPEAKPSAPPTSEPALTTSTPAVTSEPAPTTEAPAPTTEEVEVTSEPEAGAPEMPEEALEPTEAGADQFVRHWISTFNYAYHHGEPELMDPLQAEGCASCEGLAGLLKEPSTESRYLTLHETTPIALPGSATVEADITQAATAKSKETSATAVFELVHEDDRWLVAEIMVAKNA
ncbi:DUF6318 family protein [Ornithinimicrobium panacihumi]|uniref:DUF6318 family protein n=1 Tax=Ornithinimicrobium panacihumi TaxID=2008449 RepID=UPI003F899140